MGPRGLLGALLAPALLAGCVQLELGDLPVYCHLGEPRCPGGYACKRVSGVGEVCLKEGASLPDLLPPASDGVADRAPRDLGAGDEGPPPPPETGPPPPDMGPPQEAGPPPDMGPPQEAGPPPDMGPPQEAGPPPDMGPPQEAGSPDLGPPEAGSPDQSLPAPDQSLPAPDQSLPAPDQSLPAPDQSPSAPDQAVDQAAPADMGAGACGGPANTLLFDEFNLPALDTSIWTHTKLPAIVNTGRLELTSSGSQGSEVQSIKDFKYATGDALVLTFQGRSTGLKTDTSAGFEVWTQAGGKSLHSTVQVSFNGHLVVMNASPGPVGDAGVIPQECYVPIPGWSALAQVKNTFRLEWRAGQVQLLVNNKLLMTYSDSSLPTNCSMAQVPAVNMRVRLNASNQFADQLRVQCVSVFDK